MKTFRQIYFIAWAILLSIFAIETLPKLVDNIRHGRVQSPSPNASIDALLEPILQISKPSATLANSVAKIPPRLKVAFVSKENDDRCDFVYSALCYLSWPRKIDKIVGPPPPGGLTNAAVYQCGDHDASPAPLLGPHLALRLPSNVP